MIKFFRKIRQNLLSENKFSKYLIYAIGEIILVVIGILIALGINNQNEISKEKKKEKQIIYNLHQEFIQNKQIISSIKDRLKLSSNSCQTLMNLLNQDLLEPPTQNIDSLIYLSLEHTPFIPSNNIFSEIIEAGNINLITDESLKKNLFKWSTEMENTRATYKVFEKWIEDGYLPYLIKNISLRNIDKYSPMAWKKQSKFESNYNVIFKEREFENIIDNTLYHHLKMTQSYDDIEFLINKITTQTNTLNKK